jgi:hypothetical protein
MMDHVTYKFVKSSEYERDKSGGSDKTQIGCHAALKCAFLKSPKIHSQRKNVVVLFCVLFPDFNKNIVADIIMLSTFIRSYSLNSQYLMIPSEAIIIVSSISFSITPKILSFKLSLKSRRRPFIPR